MFSIRLTFVKAYLEPIVHEIKVSCADLLGDLKKPDKSAACLGLGYQCWYVLKQTAKGTRLAQPDAIPSGCGIMLRDGDRLVVDRPAPRKPNSRMPFDICMALAKATEVGLSADSEQAFFQQAKLIAAIVQRGKDLKAYSIAYS